MKKRARQTSRWNLRVGAALAAAALVSTIFAAGATAGPDGSAGGSPVQPAGQPKVAPPTRPASSRQEIERRTYPEADVQSMAAANGTTPDEARTRMRIEDALIGFEPRLRARWPETFAGVWLTSGADPRVVVAFTGDDASVRAAEAEAEGMFLMPEVVDSRRSERALAELEDLQQRMIADRSALQAGHARGEPAIDRTRGRYDLDVDVVADRVVAFTPASSAAERGEQQAAFDRRHGPGRVDVRRGVTNPSCSRANCQWTMRAGLKLVLANGGFCTSGFSAWTQSPVEYYTLTAGHCEGGELRSNGADGSYGQEGVEQVRWRVDAERIRHTLNPWVTQGRFFVSADDIRPVDEWTPYDLVVVGVEYGKSGATTGTTRGVVEGKHHSPWWVDDSSDFIRAAFCSDKGDSGSPVFRQNAAVGILSGGTDPGPGCTSIFGSIEFAKAALNVNLLAG